MEVREARPTDAAKLSSLIQHVESSSQYMLWEADEREIQPDALQKRIGKFQELENSTILVAEQEKTLVGYLFVIGGNAKRNKHSAHIVVGVHKQFRGKGVGSLLFKELDSWAKEHHLHRLELTVVTKNTPGLSLYKKAGFQIEGTKKDSLYIDGEFVDEFYMGKIL